MKKLLTACLPALALFALGGCAGTSALTSSEDDGVYYSSQDRTTAVVSTAPASTNEAANPDYNGNTSAPTARQSGSSDEYYDNSYTYMQGVPYTSPGVSYYTPYSPYTTLSYGVGSYGWGGGYCGFSPYGAGFYDPFYSPFYNPYGFGYGSGISISFGFGRPWGYGGFGGFGYGRPFGGYGFGNGFGNGFYDPFYYGGPFYGGYYGRGGYYGNNYYGNNYYRNNGGYYDNNGRGRTSGHRNYRSSDGRTQSGGRTAGTVPGTSSGGGRVRPDGLLNNPATPQTLPTASESRSATMNGGQTRTEAATTIPNTRQDRQNGSFNQPRSMEVTGQPRYRNMDQQPRQQTDIISGQSETGRDQTVRDQSQILRDQTIRDDSRNRGNRWRNADAAPQPDQMQPATAQPQENQRRRGGFFQNIVTQPRSDANPAPEQTRQRSYDQPRQQRVFDQPQQRQQQPERVYEQPQQRRQQPERVYEQPQQRNADQPQRSYSQPSYSAPSGGGGGGGRSRGRND